MGQDHNSPADNSAEATHAPKAKRTYRDAIFRAYFSEPENFIPLGEFLIRRPIKPETAALNTIDDVLFSSPRNDVSFRVGDESFTLFEQQSSVNFNMPLRLFLYLSILYRTVIPQDFLYQQSRIPLPTPYLFDLYNGEEVRPEFERLRLSDAFDHPSFYLETVVDVYNINYDESFRIIQECRPVHDYSYFIHRIRQNEKSGQPLAEAVQKAMRHCIDKDIMRHFLKQHEWEVFDMVSLVWNEEDARASYIKQGEERGEERGEKRGEERGVLRSLRSIMERLHESAENAMDILNIPAEQRPRYRQLLESGE